MCRDIVDISPRFLPGADVFFGVVVAGGVEGVFGEDFAGVAVDGHDVGGGDEDDDVGAGVGAADTEVA